MEIGIVGLPNVGKSTLFNAITEAGAESANYPFCTIEPNVGVANVPDERLTKLSLIYNSKSVIPASVKFTDIAGLVKGASVGEGLGNKFLSNIRECDAIAHIVRCFDDENIIHVDGGVDPIRDIDIINTELILSDLDLVENRMDRAKKSKKFNKEMDLEIAVLEKIFEILNQGEPARDLNLKEEEIIIIKSLNLITLKPVMYVANVSEKEATESLNQYAKEVSIYAKQQNSEFISMSARIEEEFIGLSINEKQMFMEEMGIKESGFDKFLKAGYNLLNLISYFTAGEKETRAWTIKKNTKAPSAAGKIHSDFERGFIRAEVVKSEHLIKLGSMSRVREEGLQRLEGKEYVVEDGDVMHFLFNT